MTTKFKNSETKWIEFLKKWAWVILIMLVIILYLGFWGYFAK